MNIRYFVVNYEKKSQTEVSQLPENLLEEVKERFQKRLEEVQHQPKPPKNGWVYIIKTDEKEEMKSTHIYAAKRRISLKNILRQVDDSLMQARFDRGIDDLKSLVMLSLLRTMGRRF